MCSARGEDNPLSTWHWTLLQNHSFLSLNEKHTSAIHINITLYHSSAFRPTLWAGGVYRRPTPTKEKEGQTTRDKQIQDGSFF
jgi:hypothetical protein